MRKSHALIGIAAIAGLAGGFTEACTVPVFRYALDHWPGDPYQLEAPEGWMASQEAQTLRKLLDESRTEIRLQPLAETGAPARLILPREGSVVWSGNLDENAGDLFISPAREEIAKRILSGESMVWVMVTSGNEKADRELAQRMKTRLEYLQSVAAIPEQDPNDPESKLGPGPALRVGFSFLQVGHDDPTEQVFVRMLAGPHRELLELNPETGERKPFGGVVFGRGRVLGAWPASSLDEEGLDEVSLFLLGACSCRVKVQNPGWDLALALDWDEALQDAQMDYERNATEDSASTGTEGAGGASSAAGREAEVVLIGDGQDLGKGEQRPEASSFKAHPAAGLLVGAVVALAGVFAWCCSRAGKSGIKGG